MDLLSDPCNDRQVRDYPPPPHHPLDHDLLYPHPNKPNWQLLRDHVSKEGRISKSDLL